MKRKRRPWTTKDDELIAKFWKEGKSDGDIAYIIGRIRPVVQKRRAKLKLKAFRKRGPFPGWKHTQETRDRISAALVERWKNPAYKAAHVAKLAKARAVLLGGCFRRPPKGTQEYRLYNKLCEELGPERARAELGLQTSENA